MNKVIVALSALFLSVGVFAQNGQVSQQKAEDLVKFKEVKYDFGKIKQGSPVSHDFQFSNVANQAIVLESVTPSCGCTTPIWPQAAIPKGKNEKITAGFNAQAPGPFSKTITVKVSGVDAPLIITIAGEVLTAEEYEKFVSTKKEKVGKSGGK